MSKPLLRVLRRVCLSSSLLRNLNNISSHSLPPLFPVSLYNFPSHSRSIVHCPEPISAASKPPLPFCTPHQWRVFRNLSYGSVNLVLSDGQPKFETHEIDPPKKDKWLNKKRLKQKRMREKERRRAANRTDPRRLTIKRKKCKYATPEERIKDKLEKAKIKEAKLIERLKRYEVAKLQGPVVEPHHLTGEERFYLKKMGQKASNYVPVGRRGIFGGVILNMHMHWKKHETVKVICKPCKPGQIQDYANEIARMSGGIPIQILSDDTIIFYRGKDYVQPKVMSPVDTLSKKKALEKSKYEQSLESVRHFIAVAEKELELYFRHVALYGNPKGGDMEIKSSKRSESIAEENPDAEMSSTDLDISGTDDEDQSVSDTDYDDDDHIF